MTDIALVSMPFGPSLSPSIALSLLKPQLQRAGFSASVLYETIQFAEMVGEPLYSDIADARSPSLRELIGEWIFSGSVVSQSEDDVRRYEEQVLRQRMAWKHKRGVRTIDDKEIEALLALRDLTPKFLDEALARLMAENPRIVGFTSVFQQQLASLALAKRIKAVRPDIHVIFGGANCEAIMGVELIRQFPWVDVVVSGEAEIVLPQIVGRLLEEKDVSDLRGVRTRANAEAAIASGTFTPAVSLPSLDDLPSLDYSDYFAQFTGTRLDAEWQPGLFFETSRGCWWGEKMHCTFCGLNGSTMAFRAKSADRALTELFELAERYPGLDIQVTDNILDMKYFKDFLPALTKKNVNLGLFYETKANLKREQVRMLYDAGIKGIQPGIESLSDSILKLMRKGVSALQNIQLLKWCKEYGVEPVWNILWGFPGEDPAEYERMARVAPLLTHLPPPSFFASIRLDRFSPNHFDSEKMGFANVRPLLPYEFIYQGIAPEAINNLAYYFTFDYADGRDSESYAAPLLDALEAWQTGYGNRELIYATGDERVVITEKQGAVETEHVLDGLAALLFLQCDAATDVRTLRGVAEENGFSAEDAEAALSSLCERRLMLRDGNRYLALAVAARSIAAQQLPIPSSPPVSFTTTESIAS